jgi:hypothetical protein
VTVFATSATKVGGAVGLLCFVVLAVGALWLGLAAARRENRRKLEMRRAADERDRIAEAVPDSLREPVIPIYKGVILVGAAIGGAVLGGILAGTGGAVFAFGLVMIPGTHTSSGHERACAEPRLPGDGRWHMP